MVFDRKIIGKYRKGGIMSSGPQPPRTYNQNHAPRKYIPGKRSVSISWTWSNPGESNRDTTELDNRFSTMTEVRRVAWPAHEGTEWDEMHFLQGIAGTLELFHRSTLAFLSVAGESPDIRLLYFNESIRLDISFRSTNESSRTQTH
jgi:hypothetical protein